MWGATSKCKKHIGVECKKRRVGRATGELKTQDVGRDKATAKNTVGGHDKKCKNKKKVRVRSDEQMLKTQGGVAINKFQKRWGRGATSKCKKNAVLGDATHKCKKKKKKSHCRGSKLKTQDMGSDEQMQKTHMGGMKKCKNRSWGATKNATKKNGG